MGTWYGTKEIEMIWHGEWADPELKVDERVANYWDVEQYCVDCCKEEGIDYNNDSAFGEWVRNHESEICDVIYSMTVAH